MPKSPFADWTQADADRHNAKGKATIKESSIVGEACALGDEIKALHVPFQQWCNLYQILYCCSNPTAKSSVASGRADFLVLKNGCGAAIEFKSLADPEKGLSQAQRDWRDKAQRCEVPYLLTNNLAEAIKFVTRELKL